MKDAIRTQSNCHCGQAGDQKLNMLFCVKCKRWLHAECVKCLDEQPMLFGDRFFILICKVCNAGSECLARIEMTWPEVVHLVLYNLSVNKKRKYYDLDKTIMPFLVDKWERFRAFGAIAKTKSVERRSKVLEVLQTDKKRFICFSNRFKSGKEIKKSKNIYGLRTRHHPPQAPPVQPAAAHIRDGAVVWEFEVKGRAYHILTTQKSKPLRERAKNGKARLKLHAACSKSKKTEVQKCRGGFPYNENGVKKAKHKVKRPIVVPFDEKLARKGLLDSLIPVPTKFTFANHPFRLEMGRSGKRTRCTSATKKSAPTEETAPTQNGNAVANCPSSTKPVSKEHRELLLNPLDYFYKGAPIFKDAHIIGKRMTREGKMEYLCERNSGVLVLVVFSFTLVKPGFSTKNI